MTDKRFLLVMRVSLVTFAVAVLFIALNSKLTIFQMVESAYKVTLVTAFIPLVFGLYWSRATTQGAYFAMTLGLGVWLSCEVFIKSEVWPAQIVGFIAAFVGMIAGSLLPQKIGRPASQVAGHGAVHAAAEAHGHSRAHPHGPAH